VVSVKKSISWHQHNKFEVLTGWWQLTFVCSACFPEFVMELSFAKANRDKDEYDWMM
jgi:hypothetical protein